MTKKATPPRKKPGGAPQPAAQARRARFAAEFVVDHNGTQAAIRAGYSPKTAHAQSCRLLKDAEVQRLIADGESRAIARIEVTQDKVLQAVARHAFGRLRDLFRNDKLLSVSEWSDEAAQLVAGFEVVIRPGGDIVHKVKLVDRTRNLELLGRHLKMWTDKVEHSGTVGLAAVDEQTISQLSDEDLQALNAHTAAALAVVQKARP